MDNAVDAATTTCVQLIGAAAAAAATTTIETMNGPTLIDCIFLPFVAPPCALNIENRCLYCLRASIQKVNINLEHGFNESERISHDFMYILLCSTFQCDDDSLEVLRPIAHERLYIGRTGTVQGRDSAVISHDKERRLLIINFITIVMISFSWGANGTGGSDLITL